MCLGPTRKKYKKAKYRIGYAIQRKQVSGRYTGVFYQLDDYGIGEMHTARRFGMSKEDEIYRSNKSTAGFYGYVTLRDAVWAYKKMKFHPDSDKYYNVFVVRCFFSDILEYGRPAVFGASEEHNQVCFRADKRVILEEIPMPSTFAS